MSAPLVHLVGCGPGGSEWVLPVARRVVGECDAVFGPPDLQALFPEARGARLDIPFRPEAAAPPVLAALGRGLSCAVLVRGDCGLHSLARGLQARLPEGVCRRVPGVSSVQAACAAFGLDWEGARVLSAHGRELATPDAVEMAAPLLVLLGGGPGFGRVLSDLRSLLGGAVVRTASDLTLPGETLSRFLPGETIPEDLPSRTVALVRKEKTA